MNDNHTRWGGGVYNDGRSSSPTNLAALANVSIEHNSASLEDGDLYNDGDNGDAMVTLGDTSVEDNSASNGGGLYNDANASVTLDNSNLTGNAASADGGGIYNSRLATVTFNSTTNGTSVTKNTASEGGGIYNANNSGLATVDFLDTATSVSKNTATVGGGILNLDTLSGDDTADVHNNTVGNIAT